MLLMINSNAFSNFWYMMFVCSLSTQDNAIIISSKKYMLLGNLFQLHYCKSIYCVICNKISKIIFLENWCSWWSSSWWDFRKICTLNTIWVNIGVLKSSWVKSSLPFHYLFVKALFKVTDTSNKWIKAWFSIFSINISHPRICGIFIFSWNRTSRY